MNYYFSKTVDMEFEEAVERATAVLQDEGFGVLTEIDIRATMQKKLGKDIRPYRILGACHPGYAYEALKREDKIGTMLPCNVIVQEMESGTIEVSAVDPIASMQAVDNPALGRIADEVRQKLQSVIEKI